MSPTRLDVPVTGGQLAVYELAAAPTGAPTVLAVHGITANSHAWVVVSRALDGQVRLLAVDLRGRGRSGQLPGPYGFACHTHDLLAVLDHLELERPVLAGHSLGGYIVSWLGAAHPERASAVVLVDGGLRIVRDEVENPKAMIETFLGPALERLKLRFPTPAACVEWWRAHPAFAGSDVADDDLLAYVEHDLVGHQPELHSSVSQAAVSEDGVDVLTQPEKAAELSIPATLVCAPFGLLGEPNPMQPFELAQAWASGAPDQRQAILVPDTNHYTLVLGRAGAATVADALAAAASR